MDELEIETPHGLARAHVQRVTRPRGLLVLGHGPAEWSQDADALRITLPETPPSAVGVVVKLWLEPVHEPSRKDFLHG